MAKITIPANYPENLALSDYVRHAEYHEGKIYALRVTLEGYIQPIEGIDNAYPTLEAGKKACDMHNTFIEKKFGWKKGTAQAIINHSFKTDGSKENRQLTGAGV